MHVVRPAEVVPDKSYSGLPPARILLIAPRNSYRTSTYIEAARSMGLEIMVASEGEHSLVSEIAGGLHVDLDDPAAVDELLAASRRKPFHGVIATDDASVELGSRIAGALALPHNTPQAAILTRRKDLSRERLHAAGLPVPGYRLVDLERPLSMQLEGVRFPVVVKPIALSASRGVIRADHNAELLSACGRVETLLAAESPADPTERNRILVEEFVPGPEVALEGLLRGGRLDVLAIFDKPDPMEGPFFEETYYITPSRHPARRIGKLVERVAQACSALGLREGPVHAEARICRGDAWIMEVASRTIGGYCGRLLRFGTGHRLEELIISHSIGRPLEIRPDQGAAGVLMLPIPQAGILRRVEGVMAARRVPFIDSLEISVREGYELVPLPEGASYLGFVFARAPNPEQAEAALREAHAKLRIVVAPLFRMADGR